MKKTRVSYPKQAKEILHQKKAPKSVQTKSFESVDLFEENQNIKQQLDELESQKDLGQLGGQVDTSGLQSKLTAGENIVIENNVISSTASGGMTQEQSNHLSAVYNYYLSVQTDPDPNYQPKSFSDYPSGTILQGYAKFERKYNKSFSGTITTTEMVFSAEDESAGILSLDIKFTASANFNALIKIYHNVAEISNEIISFNDNSLNFEYQKQLMGITLSKGNVFYVQISANPGNISFILKNLKAELIAPNAEVINQISPYSVEYFNGKYYISDCSSGTAKVAEINATDLHKMTDLTWIDTGISCWFYKPFFYIDNYNGTYLPGTQGVYYFYNDVVCFKNLSTNVSFETTDFSTIDWTQVGTESPMFCSYSIPLERLERLALNAATNSFAFTLRYTKTAYAVSGSKILKNYWDPRLTKEYVAYNLSNGTIETCYFTSSSSNSIIEVGKGSKAKLYFNQIDSSTYDLDCYYKYFDKIIKTTVRYSGNTPTISSQIEIGVYEEYFEGANNDYFVVKNGILEYHKKTS